MTWPAAGLPAPSADTATHQPVEQADLARFGYKQELHRRVGILCIFRCGFFLRLDPHYSLPAVLPRVRFRRRRLLLDLAGRLPRPVARRAELLHPGRQVPHLRRDLPMVVAAGGADVRLVHRLDHDHRSDPDRRGGRHRFAGGTAVHLAGLPVHRRSRREPVAHVTDGRRKRCCARLILLAVTTTINIIGVRLMSIVNSTGVVLEILGVIAIVATLLFHARRGPSVLFTTTGAAPTPGTSYIWAWLASGLMAATSWSVSTPRASSPKRRTRRAALRRARSSAPSWSPASAALSCCSARCWPRQA